MKQSRNKSINSILNGISLIIYTGINGILSLVVTKIILDNYGSDYNGLNISANQVINMLLILESGFATASNVALFTPLNNQDDDKVSRIISTTRSAFAKIGTLYFVIGSIVMIAYSFVVKSELPQIEIIFIMLIALIPTGITFLFSTKYQVLLQATQREYIINFAKTIACLVGQVIVILLAMQCVNRVVLRTSMVISPVLTVIFLIVIGKELFSQYNMKLRADYSLISGTKELLIQKFVGLIYSTAPSMIMAMQIGTKAISVYGVYTNVTILLKSLANAVLNAPRMSLGALIAEGNSDKIKHVFRKYELIVFSSCATMVSTYMALIIPFIKLYTANVSDQDYVDLFLAILLGTLFFIECIHIPSGIFITMSGRFNAAKKIQVIGAMVLGGTMTIAMVISTLHAFVVAVLLAAIVLAVLEMGYVHKKCLNDVGFTVKQILIYTCTTIILSCVEYRVISEVRSFVLFVLISAIVFVFNGFVICIVGYIFNIQEFKSLMTMVRNVVSKK